MFIAPALPAYHNSFYSTITNISYSKLPSYILHKLKALPSHLVQLIFENVFQKELTESVVFYTDGSKVDEGTYVGSAIYSPQLKLHDMYKLPSQASVFTAEAWAIYNALSIALHENLTRVTIISESKSVLDVLSNYRNKTNNYIIFYIRALVEEAKFRNTQILFIWIPSHCGIRGNETADRLAKRAIREGSETNFKIPYSDLFYIPKSHLNDNFDRYIKRSSRDKGIYYFQNFYVKNNKPWFYDSQLSRRSIATLNRLRSNHFNINQSLFRKNLINDPSCLCGVPCQDLVHIIYNCPITEKYAYPLRKALQNFSQNSTSDPNDLIIHALRKPSAKICRLLTSFSLAWDRTL